jgi:hypothetical protein
MSRHLSLAIAILCLCSLPIAKGQAKKKDTPEPEKKKDVNLRETAVEAMKKSDVKDARIVETENLVVVTALSESKAKAFADSLQKTFALAAKALKFEEAEVKAAHVIIYTFADLDNFRQFQRSVLKVRPEDELAIFDMKRDDPFIAVAARRGERNPSFELLAGNEICRALLAKKGGNARLTEWMKDGFARAVQWRLAPGTAGADRSAVARMAPRLGKTAKGMPVVDKAWSGTGKDKDLVAASLMDFFTFGPGSEKFSSVLNGLIPVDGGGDPSFGDALKAADWMLDDLDRAWREWVAKGSPGGK